MRWWEHSGIDLWQGETGADTYADEEGEGEDDNTKGGEEERR